VARVHDLWLPGPRAAFTIEKEKAAPEEVAVEGADQVVCMVENFSKAILEDTPVRPDPEEAVRTLRVLDALARSAQEEREMDV
jgi:predicted dehydrogenase